MLFHDTVRLVMRVEGDETDSHGNPILVNVDENVPAAVYALDSDKISSNFPASKNRYRILLAPVVTIPPYTSVRLEWGPYLILGSSSGGMTPDGAVERVYARGRLHHYELTTSVVE